MQCLDMLLFQQHSVGFKNEVKHKQVQVERVDKGEKDERTEWVCWHIICEDVCGYPKLMRGWDSFRDTFQRNPLCLSFLDLIPYNVNNAKEMTSLPYNW